MKDQARPNYLALDEACRFFSTIIIFFAILMLFITRAVYTESDAVMEPWIKPSLVGLLFISATCQALSFYFGHKRSATQ